MFKIIYSNYSDRIKLNLILSIQVVVILILTNIIVSSFYSRYMLYRPFEYILSNEGVMFSPEDGVASAMLEFTREDIEAVCDNLNGNTDIHMSYFYGDSLNIGESGSNKDISVYFLEDELFNGMELPLAEGTWNLSRDGDYIPCILGSNKYGITVGDCIETDNGSAKYKVVGLLTDITYEPNLSSWGSNVKVMFDNYNGENADHLFLITKYSLASSVKSEIRSASNVFIDYEKGLSEAEVIKNNSILANKGQVLTYKSIRENSLLYIYKDLEELFPVIIGAVIVICIGIVSAVSVSTESQFKKYKIFYLCGSTKKKCVLINVLTTNITIVFSVLLSASIIIMYKNYANATKISMIISKYNFGVSGVILFIFEILIIIIPAVLIGKKSVKELLYD